MQIVKLGTSDYVTTPWKNGGGKTTQLAIEPAGVTLAEPFLWRVSKAYVNASGPFSAFPGYERHIVQLTGGRMRLDHGVHGTADLAIEVPYVFSGDWPTYGGLHGDSASDLNLMVRRDDAKGHTEVWRLRPSETLTKDVASAASILVVLSGSMLAAARSSFTLGPDDCLIMKRAPSGKVGEGAAVKLGRIVLSAVESVTCVWMDIAFTK